MNQSEETIQTISRIFKLLGDPTRVRILLLLDQYGPLNVGTIAEKLHMAQSAISHQLKLLRDNHLLKNRKDGKIVYYQLDDNHVKQILEMTVQHVSHRRGDDSESH